MHIILSPAKTMAGTSKIKAPAGTTPRLLQGSRGICFAHFRRRLYFFVLIS